MSSIVIKNPWIVGEDTVYQADLLIEGGLISKIEEHIPPTADCQVISATNKYVLPGFIDIHNHGAAGFDFSLGLYDPMTDQFDPSQAAFDKGLQQALHFYYQQGTTKVLLTSMATPMDQLERAFGYLKSYLEHRAPFNKLIHGINLEGTFLLDPQYAGAQNPAYFYDIDLSLIDRLQALSGNLLRIVNVPPEHGDLGMQLIKHLVAQQIVVAGGHTGSYGEQMSVAIDRGLTLAVHFLNGPSRSSKKPFKLGGAEEWMLQSDAVSTELICDGYHISPAYVRDVISRKTVDKAILITDSMFANGRSDIEHFSLNGLEGTVSGDGRYLMQRGQTDALFGSVLTPIKGYNNLLDWLTQPMAGVWIRTHKCYSLHEAMVMASRMASTNPARLLGLDSVTVHQPGTGAIKPGHAADLVIADLNDDKHLVIDQVLAGGESF